MNPLRDHMREAPVDDERLERQFRHIQREMRPKRRRGIYAGAAGLGLAAAAALAFFFLRPEPEAPRVELFDGAQLESGADEVRVALRDGTRIALDPQSRLQLASQAPERVALGVERGRASFDVPHVDGRSFTVRAREVEVIVVGTQFSVEVEGEDVLVAVTEGTVEVRFEGQPTRRVSTGERVRVHTRVPEPERAELAPVEAPEPAEPAPAARPRPRTSPADLWDRATVARRAGHAAEAARAYEAFLRLAPRDSQAALAAFELGRLRMDQLGDVPGAVQALRRAIRMAPRAPFAEDAQARLVDAYARAGRAAECVQSRDRYLERYPNGAHRRSVEARCDSP